MKKLLLLGFLLVSITPVHSQAPQPASMTSTTPATPTTPAGTSNVAAVAAAPRVISINLVPQLKEPLAQLNAVKAANQATLDQQAKTLQALAELQRLADELRIMGKRS